MITLRFANLFLILLITLVAFAGCGRTQNITMDGIPDEDTPTPDMETGHPVKLVWFINFPEGGKAAYADWAASIAETLVTPEELVRIRSYDNVDLEMRPHRYVELEFDSFLDAATYMNRPEIAAVLEDAPNQATDQTLHTFIQRVESLKGEAGDWKIKNVILMDYSLGGKQAYLDWAASRYPALIEPPELKAAAAYDNYYGVSPHRLITLEFASKAEAVAYKALEARKAFDAEIDNHVHSRVVYTFELISDYINE